jgi:hypothetical protein
LSMATTRIGGILTAPPDMSVTDGVRKRDAHACYYLGNLVKRDTYRVLLGLCLLDVSTTQRRSQLRMWHPVRSLALPAASETGNEKVADPSRCRATWF